LLDNLTEHKAVFQSFFSVFILGYFLFHPSPLWASK
ncbi:putative membrane protein, partial [Chlamydia psittaci 02DC14]